MSREYPVLTVDCVVFNDVGELLVIQRGNEPFKGQYALPGGLVDFNESTETAAVRELEEETGVILKKEDLNFLGIYSEPGRDPRGHYVSAVYVAKFPEGSKVEAGDDAATAQFIKNYQELDFAFDHKKILEDALKTIT